ncbi:MAG: DsbA family protein [Hyphomonas sp.]|nr:DsbA family protein [Hyphomonas sp.]HRX73608.1 DsbA family protein [Hyphomonas sp.]
MIRPLFVTAAFALVAMTPACADASKSTAMERSEIESIVHEYIVNHPEVIEEAIIALNARDRAEAAQAAKDAIADNHDKLYNLATDHFIGPADAPVTVVEFFDYRCGYCKRSMDYVQGLPAQYDNKVRVVFKEYPIFGGISEDAALAALAAGKQGKYNDMHKALMGLKSNDELTDKKIDALAEGLGLNVKKMRADMKSTELKKQLDDMQKLGHTLNLGGTPGFYIGETAIEGADQNGIEKAIEAALKG